MLYTIGRGGSASAASQGEGDLAASRRASAAVVCRERGERAWARRCVSCESGLRALAGHDHKGVARARGGAAPCGAGAAGWGWEEVTRQPRSRLAELPGGFGRAFGSWGSGIALAVDEQEHEDADRGAQGAGPPDQS